MKKFIFSAVALVAFSFAGMANTGGEEKLNNKILIEEKLPEPECCEYSNFIYDLVYAKECDHVEAGNFAYVMYSLCLWN